ncbi:MAG TPA: hypothetical protein VF807_11010, partial [Ktedonobacterales bacterium]
SVYDYTFTAQADLDARGVSADGTQITSGIGPARHAIAVDWIAPPHWFKRGHVIVLYVGSDSVLQHSLRVALGPQFAGGAVECATAGPCDTLSLLAALRTRGATATLTKTMPVESEPMHTQPGTVAHSLMVNGTGVFTMEFPSDTAASSYATFISDTARAGVIIDYAAPPHFFRVGHLIVEYVGRDTHMIDLLTGVLGPAFFSEVWPA